MHPARKFDVGQCTVLLQFGKDAEVKCAELHFVREIFEWAAVYAAGSGFEGGLWYHMRRKPV